MNAITTEAMRYVENARQILSEKANKYEGYYEDRKYVKMAGDTAYKGVLLALDAVIPAKKGRKDVDSYREFLAKTDRKMLGAFNGIYDTLHRSMGYDGNPDADVASVALKRAEQIIDWVGTRLVEA